MLNLGCPPGVQGVASRKWTGVISLQPTLENSVDNYVAEILQSLCVPLFPVSHILSSITLTDNDAEPKTERV